MTGHELRVVVNPHEPWFYLLNNTECAGILCELLKYVCSSLNRSYCLMKDPVREMVINDGQDKEFK